MSCVGEGARIGDWCEAPPLVWVELAALPFWLEPTTVVDMLAGWCSWTSRMSPAVERSKPSAMVERVWVGGGGRDVLFWVKVWGKPSSGCKHWLVGLGGIIRVFFVLGTRWTPNIGIKQPKAA
jgi:hypothetical protein